MPLKLKGSNNYFRYDLLIRIPIGEKTRSAEVGWWAILWLLVSSSSFQK